MNMAAEIHAYRLLSLEILVSLSSQVQVMLTIHKHSIVRRRRVEMRAKPSGELSKFVHEVLLPTLFMMVVCHDEFITQMSRV